MIHTLVTVRADIPLSHEQKLRGICRVQGLIILTTRASEFNRRKIMKEIAFLLIGGVKTVLSFRPCWCSGKDCKTDE